MSDDNERLDRFLDILDRIADSMEESNKIAREDIAMINESIEEESLESSGVIH